MSDVKNSNNSNNSASTAQNINKFNTFKPKSKSKIKKDNGKSTAENEDKLTKSAIDEILKETARAAIRAETAGPSGWLPCPLAKTNKRFLANTMKSVISHNKRQQPNGQSRTRKKSEKELDEIIAKGQKRTPKFGHRRHVFRRPTVKEHKDKVS